MQASIRNLERIWLFWVDGEVKLGIVVEGAVMKSVWSYLGELHLKACEIYFPNFSYVSDTDKYLLQQDWLVHTNRRNMWKIVSNIEYNKYNEKSRIGQMIRGERRPAQYAKTWVIQPYNLTYKHNVSLSGSFRQWENPPPHSGSSLASKLKIPKPRVCSWTNWHPQNWSYNSLVCWTQITWAVRMIISDLIKPQARGSSWDDNSKTNCTLVAVSFALVLT